MDAVEWFREMFRYCTVNYDGKFATIHADNIDNPKKVQRLINNRFGKRVARINDDGSITVKLTD